jgi:hypothetical protein
VYSSGIANVNEHARYDAMEAQALDMASTIIMFSDRDKESLQTTADPKALNPNIVNVLLPPLRSDVARLARCLHVSLPPLVSDVEIQARKPTRRCRKLHGKRKRKLWSGMK